MCPSAGSFQGVYSSSTISEAELLRIRATYGTVAGSHEVSVRRVYTLTRL